MAQDFGTGVSRVLDPNSAALLQVIWQEGKPPTDAELNLNQQLATDHRQLAVLRGMPSGWLGNDINMSESFVTNPIWSNWFRFGQQRSNEQASIEWAAVNGWLVPVTGTMTGTPPGAPNDASTWNRVTLDPPPSASGDSRIDYMFLEVWMAKVAPNPSATNKPSASGLWRYGNVESGYTFLADDLQDPDLGFETTQRVQLQYRVRVVSGLVGLTTFPDGFDTTVVKGQGAATTETGFTFSNMREELGDPGLWRAGDGTSNTLGTIDGYVYAVPLCAIFRRNVVAWDGDPSQNLNGSFNRNPTAVDRTGWDTFSTTPELGADLTDVGLALTLDSASDIPLPLTPATPVFIKVGDEIMTYSVITGTTMTLVSRGALGSRAEAHFSGDTITVLSGRPDGLFADQIAKTDILDLRHAVSPNGFDYDTLLRGNLDKLLRGQLRSNWKRSGGGPQGSFVFYQDKVSASAAALGVTKLDGPDGFRQVFSDAAMQQPIELFLTPPGGTGAAEDVSTTWGLGLTASFDNTAGAGGQWLPGNDITIPAAQLKGGVSGFDADQIRWMGIGNGAGSITMRIQGQEFFLREGFHFSVGAISAPTDDLTITLLADFPAGTTEGLVVVANVLYGPGRGLSRRPDSLHSVAYLSSGSDIMTQLSGIPADNIPLRTAWAPLWSKFRKAMFNNLLPITAEAYADPGSKTLILTPFRRVELPNNLRALDGEFSNVNTGATAVATSALGSVSSATDVFTDGGGPFGSVVAGDALVIPAGSNAGVYIVQAAPPPTATTLNVNRQTALATFTFDVTESNITYSVYKTQGLMPLAALDGTAKWSTTDPLGLFSGETDPTANLKNVYLPIKRNLMPGWSEVRVPIVHGDPTSIPAAPTTGTFHQGINFGILTKKGPTPGDSEKNFVPFDNGTLSYAPMSTLDLLPETTATFNTSFSFGGDAFAGIRKFTDTRNLGREGLELPPFYGIARLFAVYEALDYKANGSAFDPTSREPVAGNATNLLRQDISEATFWIEVDDDGDSTFILNANAIDIARSPNAIASFASGNYVVEASIFGFDRGSFDLDQEFRLVLTRERNDAASGTRANNFGANPGTNAVITTPDLVVPAPVLASDEVSINYSRTPYQGDAWGSQTNQTDISYLPGPLTTGTLFQLTSTELDESALTRPNQKALEVLSSVGFATTLGSGRLSGDFDSDATFDFRTVGYEDLNTAFPPTTGVDDRYTQKIPALESEESNIELGTSYHNCIERLPLGAIFRDKDFRGNFLSGVSSGDLNQFDTPLIFAKDLAPSFEGFGLAASSSLEQTEVPINTPSQSSGQPGEVLAHVDGEQGNYALLTNFRTIRGGSVFRVNGPRPGGETVAQLTSTAPSFTTPGVLSGIAYLVRNTVTSVGANEVSAGSEMMLLIVTTGKRLGAVGEPLKVFLGTNGTGEGVSAADLYRIEGRPLVRDNVRVEIDPSTITLPKKRPANF